MPRMTLSRRLLLTITIALIALLFVGGLGLWRLNQAQQRFEYVQSNIIPSVKELTDSERNIGTIRRLAALELSISGDSAARTANEQAMAEANASLVQHLATYERN